MQKQTEIHSPNKTITLKTESDKQLAMVPRCCTTYRTLYANNQSDARTGEIAVPCCSTTTTFHDLILIHKHPLQPTSSHHQHGFSTQIVPMSRAKVQQNTVQYSNQVNPSTVCILLTPQSKCTKIWSDHWTRSWNPVDDESTEADWVCTSWLESRIVPATEATANTSPETVSRDFK